MLLSKEQLIKATRSELMFENDWMDYAEANQLALEEWEDYDYITGAVIDGDLEDVQ